MDRYLYKLYEELAKKGMPLEAYFYDHHSRSRIIDEIRGCGESWEYSVKELIDINNWNLDRLVIEEPNRYIRSNIYYESYHRKPKAYFDLFLTQKNNLALDWYPYNIKSFPRPLAETDWLHWDNSWQAGMEPFNRVLMIRDFERFVYHRSGKPYDTIDKLIVEAVKELIDRICHFLERFIEIEKLSDLYLTYDNDRYDGNLLKVEFRDPKEVEKEKVKLEKDKRISDMCREFDTIPQKVLEEFKRSGMKYGPAAKKLSTTKATLSPYRLKKLIQLLYNSPGIYDAVMDQPPPGIEPRKTGAEIVKVDFRNGRSRTIASEE